MLEAMLGGLAIVLSWPAILYMLLGVFTGLFLGVLPGIGGPVILALLLPFAFTMGKVEALTFLLSAHAVGVTGGSITAILFGVPGTGTNAATVLDGYPLAQRGEAGRAIGAALTASAVGGVMGALTLGLLIPVLRPLVLSFGPSEFLMLSVMGLAFLSSLSEGDHLKAIISGLLGLMFSFVGEETIMGTKRFTFGQLYLWEGVKLVPAVVGLFAVAEMVSLLAGGGSIARNAKVSWQGGPLAGVREVFKKWGLVLRCSIIGIVVGIVPGLGGDVACFIAYGHGAQTTREKVKFGEGNIDGVIAPESANNAKEGGALVPTIGFGIPGSAGMAVLLGALMMIGLTPGKELLQSHLDITFSLVWMVSLANILAAVIMLFVTPSLARLTVMEGSVLAPGVLIVALIGSYLSSESLGDVMMALAIGLLGYGMKRYHYSRATFILGLVLGKIVEQNLFLSLRIHEGFSFLVTRPITFLLFVTSVLVAFFPLYRHKIFRTGPNRQHPGGN
jgi:TctA family transporter